VVRTDSTAGTCSVQVVIVGATTAKSGTDYTIDTALPVTLTFNPGDYSKSVIVSIVGNHSGKAPVTLVLLLTNPTGGASIGSPGSYVLTIGDGTAATTATATATPTASPAATITPTTQASSPTPTPVPEPSITPTPAPTTENTSSNWTWLLLLLLIPLAGIVIYYVGFMRNK
jgi:hypothetical protein